MQHFQILDFLPYAIIGMIVGCFFVYLMNSKKTISVLREEYQNINNKKIELDVRLMSALEQLAELKEELLSKHQEIDTLRQENTSHRIINQNLEETIQNHKHDILKIKDQFSLHFENLAQKIFFEHSKSFTEQSKNRISEIVAPLKSSFSDFRNMVNTSFGNNAKEQFALKQEIEKIADINQKISQKTEELTSALRGNVKLRGNWGEIILEKILEEAGLRKNKDYTLQGQGQGLKHPETKKSLRPDVIVNLPENKHIIIDAKTPLNLYENYCMAKDSSTKSSALKSFIVSLKKQIEDLETRRYQDAEKLLSPEFVIMFIPVEGAYLLATEHYNDIHNYAWSHKIVVAGPTTLFATLKTISSLWRIAKQNENAIEIAQKSGALYDKLVIFIEDLKKLSYHIEQAHILCSRTTNKITSNKNNLLVKTIELKELGAITSKPPPIL